jgi:DNA primase
VSVVKLHGFLIVTYLKNNFFHCFGCGANGDTIDLLVKRDGLSFKEAVIKLQ